MQLQIIFNFFLFSQNCTYKIHPCSIQLSFIQTHYCVIVYYIKIYKLFNASSYILLVGTFSGVFAVVLFFERARACVCARREGRQRERKSENPHLHTQHGVWHRAVSHPWNHELRWNQESDANQLSHQAPLLLLFSFLFWLSCLQKPLLWTCLHRFPSVFMKETFFWGVWLCFYWEYEHLMLTEFTNSLYSVMCIDHFYHL